MQCNCTRIFFFPRGQGAFFSQLLYIHIGQRSKVFWKRSKISHTCQTGVTILKRAWGYTMGQHPPIMQNFLPWQCHTHSHLNSYNPKNSQPQQSWYTYSDLHSRTASLWKTKKYQLPSFYAMTWMAENLYWHVLLLSMHLSQWTYRKKNLNLIMPIFFCKDNILLLCCCFQCNCTNWQGQGPVWIAFCAYYELREGQFLCYFLYHYAVNKVCC